MKTAYRNRILSIIKCLIFGIGLVALIYGYMWVVSDKTSDEIYTHNNYYDVIFVGTSMTVANLSNEELYLEYGIAGGNVGQNAQFVYLSYYALEEALKHQNPQTVLFDVKAMFYTEEQMREWIENSEYGYVHATLDGMRNSVTKYNAFCQTKELYEDSCFWDYFSDVYYYHSNWKDITSRNFKGFDNMNGNYMNGNYMGVALYEGYGRTASIYETENNGEEAEIASINYEYFDKMVELCRRNDVQLVLTYSQVIEHWDWTRYNAVRALADKYGLEYLDINILQEAAGLQWATDMYDPVHLNISGAKKWTDYIGEYLINNYEFVDRREDDRYHEYAEKEKRYNDFLEAMNTYNLLNSATTFNEYLEELNDVGLNNNIIIVVSDTLPFDMNEENYKKFKKLGSTVDLESGDTSYYMGIFSGDGIEEKQSDKVIECEENVQGIDLTICTGTYEIPAVIEFGGENLLISGSGLNFLVYNLPCEKVLSTVFFSTWDSDNPRVCRMEDTGAMAIQIQGEGNTWSTIGYE